jgi:hypothetical protein
VTEVEASFVRGLETLIARGENAQTYNHFLGEPDSFTRHIDLFRNATTEQIRATAAAYLPRSKRIEVITIPGTGGAGNGKDAKPAPVSSATSGAGKAAN